MNILGIELCDAGLASAREGAGGSEMIGVGAPEDASLGWPGIARSQGGKLVFGPEAEAAWFVHPRDVSNLFWDKLSHESSELSLDGTPYSHSQLAFYFLRDYLKRITAATGAPDKIGLAVPGRYLRDSATEEEKIGLLLGMAAELELPLTRITDMACAALGEPAARQLPRGAPIIHVDVHLHASEISLLRQEDMLVRKRYHHVPQVGYAQILRHLKNAMGNRFLRHTAFDIHEDRRLEQAFYEQTRLFLLGSEASRKEFLYELNTGRRSYQMPMTRLQLATDLQPFDQALLQGVSVIASDSGTTPGGCIISLTDRASRLDGFENLLREAGFSRIFRLRPGAAAMGAASLAMDAPIVTELDEMPVEITAPLQALSTHDIPVEFSLQRLVISDGPAPVPSHVIIDGIGHPIGANGICIGTRHTHTAVDVSLPEAFDAVGDYLLRIQRDGTHLRLEAPGDKPGTVETSLGAGDRLTLRGGGRSTELLFAYCPAPGTNDTTPEAD